MTDIAARLDTLHDEIKTEFDLGGYFDDRAHIVKAQAKLAALVAALRAVLDLSHMIETGPYKAGHCSGCDMALLIASDYRSAIAAALVSA